MDLVFSGHVHSYARTCNVLDERCVDMDEGGTTHITLGCGGHTLCGPSSAARCSPLPLEPVTLSALLWKGSSLHTLAS